MRRTTLFFLLCVSNGSCGPSSGCAGTDEQRSIELPEQTSPQAPTLQVDLQVKPNAPKSGDPVALFGGRLFVCAARHEADTACAGRLYLSGRPQTDMYHRYAMGDVAATDKPLALQGVRAKDADAKYGARAIITEDDELRVWVSGNDRDFEGKEVPTPIPLVDRARDVAIESLRCAVTISGSLVCWGREQCLQPGDAEPRDFEPARLSGIEDALAVGVGHNLLCVLDRRGHVRCRGYANIDRECLTTDFEEVEGLSGVVELAVGRDAACALTASGEVKCWGADVELLRAQERVPGDYHLEPVKVDGLGPIVELDAYDSGVCALQADGDVFCWGSGFYGRKAPAGARRIPNIENAIDIVVANSYGCALLANREVRCFGSRADDWRKQKGDPLPFEGKDPWVDAPYFKIEKGVSPRDPP